MSKAARKDVLDEMTKDELVDRIWSQPFLKKPKRSEVLYLRRHRQSADVIAEMEKENRALTPRHKKASRLHPSFAIR
ncbi:hypothetical protein [Pseudomonas vranovensis]|uniref:hypothetical protein n=1 Tax=Pseudomonas vranovensis TaxID=321661 RepID=UPI003D984BC1